MTLEAVMSELEANGSEQTKRTLVKHGAREPFFGVKIEYLHKILKLTKNDHELALSLWKTGVSDAMYLAGLMADPQRMTRADLESWVGDAYWSMLSETSVPALAAEGPHGWDLGLEWIDRSEETVACAGWSALAGVVALKEDADLDLAKLKALLVETVKRMPTAQNRVKYAMNNFVLAVGAYVAPLREAALAAARAYGSVEVDMGGTACKVPEVGAYLEKMEAHGKLGVKRKAIRC